MKVFSSCLSAIVLFQLLNSVMCSDYLQNCVCTSSSLHFDDDDYAQSIIGYNSGPEDATAFISCTNDNSDDSYELKIRSTNSSCLLPNKVYDYYYCSEENKSLTVRMGATSKTFIAEVFCKDSGVGFNACELSCTFCVCPGIYPTGCYTSQSYSKTNSINGMCIIDFKVQPL